MPIAQAEQSTEEYDIKAVFLFHFIDFSIWPTHVENNMTICIYGHNPFENRLQLLAETISKKKIIKIKLQKNLELIDDCQILFVHSTKQNELPSLVNLLNNKPILTVSDMDNFASNKGMIGLLVQQDKIKIEINLDSVKASGIQISSNLIELATVINTEHENSGGSL